MVWLYMKMKKYENFCRAYANLCEASETQPPYSTLELTGLVALFEIAFEQAWKMMKEVLEFHGYSAIPLLDKEGKYIGTITEGDLLWYLKDHDFPDIYQLEDIPITDIERKRDNNAVNIQVSMEELFEKATNQNFVPVVDDNNVFIGIITRKDIILYLANKDNAN